jgi:hypothetical protein
MLENLILESYHHNSQKNIYYKVTATYNDYMYKHLSLITYVFLDDTYETRF